VRTLFRLVEEETDGGASREVCEDAGFLTYQNTFLVVTV
jgi:hypothetical protein